MNTVSMAVIRREQIALERAAKTLKDLLAVYEQTKRLRDRAAQDEVFAFLEIGIFLLNAREKSRHGQWEQWLAEQFSSVSTGGRYMRVTRKFAEKVDGVWVLKAPALEDLNGVAALMRLAGENLGDKARASAAVEWAIDVALRWARPPQWLSVEAALARPIGEQHALKLALEPTHALYEALPAPPP